MIDACADGRLARLHAWLAGIFGSDDFTVTVASADASFRRYFRVTRGAETWIAMDAPPDKEDMAPYVRVAQMLTDIGVNAPRILAHDPAAGFLLNCDLGAQTYLAALQAGADAGRLYGDAIAALIRIQTRGARHAAGLPPYDAALLERELQLFPEWFLGRHLGIELDDSERAALQDVFAVLVASACAQPAVFVHRDYHSRNLMVCAARNPGILDFQDAVRGPLTYDLVSLLRDCYIAWPEAQVREWALEFRAAALAAGMDVLADEAAFLHAFDLMGVQRHLKAIGIFARLWHRDGKPGYLDDIPRTLGYVQAVGARHAQLGFLARLIEERVWPALARMQPTGEAGSCAP
ncbi:MAG: phosphotransferase [Pseudomonadota bacterium]